MRVMLINSNQLKHPWPVIPFGLCSVAAALEREKHRVKVLDLCFSGHPGKDIQSAIKDFQPGIIGISIRNIDNVGVNKPQFYLPQIKKKIIRPSQRAFTGPIVIGGAAVGISGVEMLDFFDLGLAIRGDGEPAMVELVRRLEDKLPLEGIGGLIRREEGEIVEENPPSRLHNLNHLPSIKFHRYLDLHQYRRFNSPLQIQTKRGCALRCTYCIYNRIEGQKYRLRDPWRVADEIEALVLETGIKYLEFTDSTFNIPLEHAKAVLRAVASKGLDLQCRTMGLNPGAVDEELVELMKEVGFREVDLGAESCCDTTLQSLGKSFTKQDVLRAGKLLAEKKIPTSWFLLVGAPGETRETLKETFETVSQAASKWDLIIVGAGIRAYCGALIAEQMKEKDPGCTHDNFLRPVSYSPDTLNLRTINILAKQAFFRYTNFLIFEEHIRYPVILLKIVNALFHRLAPKQPIWRMYLLIRNFQKYTGVNKVKGLAFDLKYRKQLKRG